MLNQIIPDFEDDDLLDDDDDLLEDNDDLFEDDLEDADDIFGSDDDDLEDADDIFGSDDDDSEEDLSDVIENKSLDMILDSYSFTTWLMDKNDESLSNIDYITPEESQLSNYGNLIEYQKLALGYKTQLINSNSVAQYNSFKFIIDILRLMSMRLQKLLEENGTNKKGKQLDKAQQQEMLLKLLMLRAVLDHEKGAKNYNDLINYNFSSAIEIRNTAALNRLEKDFKRLVEMFKFVWELSSDRIDTEFIKSIKEYKEIIRLYKSDLSVTFSPLEKARDDMRRLTIDYEKRVNIVNNSTKLSPEEKQNKLSALSDINDRTSATYRESIESAEKAIIKQYTFPKKIEFIKGRCHVTCSCGNVLCDDEDCTSDIKKKRFITFNVIQYETNEYNLFKAETLNVLLEICNSKSVRTYDTLLREIKDPDYVFSSNNTLRSSDIKAGMATDKTAVSGSESKQISAYIDKVYGSACFHVPFYCESCGKTILMQPRLLRYLVAWHASHGNSIFVNYDGFTSTGFISYKDSLLNELIEEYMTKESEAIDEKISALESKIESLSSDDVVEAYQTNLEIKKYRAEEKMVSMEKPDYDEEVIDLEPSSVEEVYRRVAMRKNNYNVGISYFKNTQQTRGNTVTIAKKGTVPSSYWEEYNNKADSVYDSLNFIVENADICNSTEPVDLINCLLLAPFFKQSRDSIVRYGIYNILKVSVSIFNKIISLTDDVITTVPWTSNNSIITLDKIYASKLLFFIKDKLIDLNDNAAPDVFEKFTTEDEVNTIEFTVEGVKHLSELMNKIDSKCATTIISDYNNLSNPLSMELHRMDYNDDEVDTEAMQFINNQLPWKVWCEYVMVFMLLKHNSTTLIPFATQGTKNALKSTKGASRILKGIQETLVKGTNNQVIEKLTSKVPPCLRDNSPVTDTVLPETMLDCVIRSSIYPVPITGRMVEIVKSNDIDIAIKLLTAYLESTEYSNDADYLWDDEYANPMSAHSVKEIYEDISEFIAAFIA